MKFKNAYSPVASGNSGSKFMKVILPRAVVLGTFQEIFFHKSLKKINEFFAIVKLSKFVTYNALW